MRYAQNHKSETHAKLLRIAGKALREKGPDKLAVAEVMQAAGLTHGGFYAHFKSKDALLAEALEGVFAYSKEKYRRLTEGLPPRHALATYVDFYVSPEHRDNPSRGCPIVALNSDLPRQSRKFRTAFDSGMKSLIGALAHWIAAAGIEGANDNDADVLAASVLSAMAGAVAVSRAVSDKRLSDEMLEAARAGIKARLGVTDVALSGSVVP